jgi:hypothetical protein
MENVRYISETITEGEEEKNDNKLKFTHLILAKRPRSD